MYTPLYISQVCSSLSIPHCFFITLQHTLWRTHMISVSVQGFRYRGQFWLHYSQCQAAYTTTTPPPPPMQSRLHLISALTAPWCRYLCLYTLSGTSQLCNGTASLLLFCLPGQACCPLPFKTILSFLRWWRLQRIKSLIQHMRTLPTHLLNHCYYANIRTQGAR